MRIFSKRPSMHVAWVQWDLKEYNRKYRSFPPTPSKRIPLRPLSFRPESTISGFPPRETTDPPRQLGFPPGGVIFWWENVSPLTKMHGQHSYELARRNVRPRVMT